MISTSICCCARNRIRNEVLRCGGLHSTKGKTRFGRLFSSSSAKREPRLSARNKRDMLILVAGTSFFFAYYLFHKDDNWEDDVWTLQNKLKASVTTQNQNHNENSACDITENKKLLSHQQNSFSNHPPPVVLKYIEKVLRNYRRKEDDTNSFGNIVITHQSGEFLASRQWYPFEANLMAAVSTTNPGFVWDAQTTIINLSNNVLEYFITSKDIHDNKSQQSEIESGCVTKVWGKYPLIEVEEEDPYILFWLAMTPLFPAVFLTRNQGLLQWMNSDVLFDNSRTTHSRKEVIARAQLVDGAHVLLVEFFFGEDDELLYKIKVTTKENDEREIWQAAYKNYAQHAVAVDRDEGTNAKDQHDQNKSSRILVPSSIEIGKGVGDNYRPHFKIYNRNIGICE